MNKPEVIFNKEKHSYTVNGKLAVSVTTLLQEVGITQKLSEVQFLVDNPHILEEARERGNYYDGLAEEALIEMKYVEGDRDLTPWQKRLVKELENIGHQIPSAQERLGMEDDFIAIAGTPDIIEEIEHYIGNELYIGIVSDVKATGQIRINDVTWQTNMYAWLKDKNNHDKYAKYVVHYDEKIDKFTVIRLENIAKTEIENAISAYLMGEQYTEQFQVVDPEKFNKLLKEIQNFKTLLKEKEEILKQEEERIMNEMKSRGIKKIENELFRLTYTPEGERRTFDNSAWLKSKGFPEPTEEEKKEFVKVSVVKHKLTITEKK